MIRAQRSVACVAVVIAVMIGLGSVLPAIIGGVAVYYLWRRESSEFFAPRSPGGY